MTHILSVSVSNEDKMFIDAFNLSPSKLIQERIFQLMEHKNSGLTEDNIETYKKKFEFFKDKAYSYQEFLVSKGLLNEYEMFHQKIIK